MLDPEVVVFCGALGQTWDDVQLRPPLNFVFVLCT